MEPSIALDRKDRKILFELDMKPRQSHVEIGKKVGMSSFGVGYRIKRMIDLGVIKGFFSLIDASKLGYAGFRIYMKLENISPAEEQNFIDFLVKQPNIFWVNTYLHGIWDIGCHIWANDVHAFHEIWLEVLKKYQRYIKEAQISQHLKILHFRKDYLIGKKRDFAKPVELGGSSKINLDNYDIHILRILSHNAMEPLLRIAEKVKLTPMAVKYRINKMVKNKIILGLRPMINLNKLGYEWYKINFYLNNVERKKELVNYVSRNPNLVHIYDAIGLSDFEIGIEVRDVNEFYAILMDIRSRFSDVIRDYDYFIIFKEHKLLFMPDVGSL